MKVIETFYLFMKLFSCKLYIFLCKCYLFCGALCYFLNSSRFNTCMFLIFGEYVTYCQLILILILLRITFLKYNRNEISKEVWLYNQYIGLSTILSARSPTLAKAKWNWNRDAFNHLTSGIYNYHKWYTSNLYTYKCWHKFEIFWKFCKNNVWQVTCSFLAVDCNWVIQATLDQRCRENCIHSFETCSVCALKKYWQSNSNLYTILRCRFL